VLKDQQKDAAQRRGSSPWKEEGVSKKKGGQGKIFVFEPHVEAAVSRYPWGGLGAGEKGGAGRCSAGNEGTDTFPFT